MRILAIERDVANGNADYQPHLQAEARRVWELQQDGVLRDIVFTTGERRAVLTLECASVDEARRVLATLPLVRERCIDFDVHGLVAYDGYARLFAPAS
jgi:muconolactone delta-isomerase